MPGTSTPTVCRPCPRSITRTRESSLVAGGQGSIIGAISGMVFMALMSNAFNLFFIPPQWQNIMIGIILLLVITVDGYVSLSKQKQLGKI